MNTSLSFRAPHSKDPKYFKSINLIKVWEELKKINLTITPSVHSLIIFLKISSTLCHQVFSTMICNKYSRLFFLLTDSIYLKKWTQCCVHFFCFAACLISSIYKLFLDVHWEGNTCSEYFDADFQDSDLILCLFLICLPSPVWSADIRRDLCWCTPGLEKSQKLAIYFSQ